MKFSELQKHGTAAAARDGILRHTETMRALFIASGDRGEHYALWTNGGAAIALLSFMAASERLRALSAAWYALTCFAIGVVSCGLLCASNFHIRQRQFIRWINDSEDFFADKIDHSVLFGNARRPSQAWWGHLPVAFGYISFLSFIAGLLIAFTQLMPSAARPLPRSDASAPTQIRSPTPPVSPPPAPGTPSR